MFVSGMIQLASASEATVSTHEVSMWRTLWNDLFSQVVLLIQLPSLIRNALVCKYFHVDVFSCSFRFFVLFGAS